MKKAFQGLRASVLFMLPFALIGALGCTPSERDFGNTGALSSGAGGAGGSEQGSGGGGGDGGAAPSIPCNSPAECPGAQNASATCLDNKCGIVCDSGYLECDSAVAGCETMSGTKESCGSCGDTCATSCFVGDVTTPSFCNDPIDITAGLRHTCALRKDGTVWCWGSNVNGEIGDPGGPPATLSPVQVKLPFKATKVVAGGSINDNSAHTCVILEDTSVSCWGSGKEGQIGNGLFGMFGTPQQVSGLKNVIDIAVGGAHTCAVTDNSELYCWGFDGSGQMGNGNPVDELPAPNLVMTGVKSVAAGEQHTCAAMSTGALFCWGNNSDGQLGIGNQMNAYSPVKVKDPLDLFVDEVSAGDRHTCVRQKNEVLCFGNDYNGAVGIGGSGPVPVPTLVPVPDVKQVEVGRERSGAISGPMGLVKMWGVPAVGDGSSKIAFTPVDAKIDGVTRIALGYHHTCALRATGEVLCWGDNSMGQLGNSMVPDAIQYAPVPVMFAQ